MGSTPLQWLKWGPPGADDCSNLDEDAPGPQAPRLPCSNIYVSRRQQVLGRLVCHSSSSTEVWTTCCPTLPSLQTPSSHLGKEGERREGRELLPGNLESAGCCRRVCRQSGRWQQGGGCLLSSLPQACNDLSTLRLRASARPVFRPRALLAPSPPITSCQAFLLFHPPLSLPFLGVPGKSPLNSIGAVHRARPAVFQPLR